MPEVVQPDAGQTGRRARPAPLVADGVLVRRGAGGRGDEPTFRATGGQVPLDVPGDQGEQPVGDDDCSLRAVLGCPQLCGAVGSALHLAADHDPAAEEVDVADLQRSGLAEPETAEGADGDEAGGGRGGHTRHRPPSHNSDPEHHCTRAARRCRWQLSDAGQDGAAPLTRVT